MTTLPQPKKPSSRNTKTKNDTATKKTNSSTSTTTTSKKSSNSPTKQNTGANKRNVNSASIPYVSSSTLPHTHLPKPPQHRSPSQPKNNILLWLLLFVLVAGVGYYFFGQRSTLFSPEQSVVIDKNALFVGKEVELEGILEPLIERNSKYTHTFTNIQYNIIGVRSSRFNLSNFEGEVQIKGKVIDLHNNTYIIDVVSIASVGNTTEYFSSPGLLIQPMNKDGFVVSDSNGLITITNEMTNSKIIVRSFQCDETQARNCTLFEEGFIAGNLSYVQDKYKNTYYKLNDQNTWFVNIDNRYGVYIEATNTALLPLFVKNTQFVTTERALQKFRSQVQELCSNTTINMIDITSGSLIQTSPDTWILNIIGSTQNAQTMTCELGFDSNNIDKLTVKTIALSNDQTTEDIIINEETEQEPIEENEGTPIDTEPTPSTSSSSISLTATQTTQIPLRPGKELEFITRGMKIIFPSPNIAFASKNVSNMKAGLDCTISTNIIGYVDKANLLTNPTVVLYFCPRGAASLDNNMRVITTDTANIIIEVLDPAWIDFANNIVVQ